MIINIIKSLDLQNTLVAFFGRICTAATSNQSQAEQVTLHIFA